MIIRSRKRRTPAAAIRRVNALARTYRKNFAKGDGMDMDLARMEVSPMLFIEGWDANAAREAAVKMFGFVPAELATAYGMQPSDEERENPLHFR